MKNKTHISREALCLIACYLFQQYRLCGFCHCPEKTSTAPWLEGKAYYQEHYEEKSSQILMKLEPFSENCPSQNHLQLPLFFRVQHLLIRLLPHSFQKYICRLIFSRRKRYLLPCSYLAEFYQLFLTVRNAYSAKEEPAYIPELISRLGAVLRNTEDVTLLYIATATTYRSIEEIGHPSHFPLIPLNELLLSLFHKTEEEILKEDWFSEK